MHLPGDVEITEQAAEVMVEIDDDQIADLYLNSENERLDAAYQHGVALLKKYQAPPSVVEELDQWHRDLENNECSSNFFKLWGDAPPRLGLEIRYSVRPETVWICSLVVDFHSGDGPKLTQADATKYLNNLRIDWENRAKSSERVQEAPDNPSRGTYTYQELMVLLMEQCRTTQARRRIVDVLSFDQLPTFADQVGFADEVAYDAAYAFARTRDCKSLVALLSIRCPPIAWDENIESAVVNHEFTDGFLVLCDAFDASSDARVRGELANAMRRALCHVGVDESDDQKMASASRAWFMQHRQQIQTYHGYEASPGIAGSPGRSQPPGLFVRREGSK